MLTIQISPVKWLGQFQHLCSGRPETEGGCEVLEALWIAKAHAEFYKTQALHMQVEMVLQGLYCEWLHSQLATQEQKKKKNKGGKLSRDGMPQARLLTSDDFMAKVMAQDEAQAAAARQKKVWQEGRQRRAVEVAEWHEAEKLRKTRNEEWQQEWLDAVKEWEEEHDQIGKRPGLKKPLQKDFPSEKPIPKPTMVQMDGDDSDKDISGDDEESDEEE